MTIKEALTWAGKLLEDRKVEGPKASANFLLRRVLSCDKVYLIVHDDKQLTTKEEKKFRDWVDRRVNHEPVWYITETIEFGELVLAVNEHVLIPRPETELLVERVIQEITNYKLQITNKIQNSKLENSEIHSKLRTRNSKLRILDIGTGSGTIILSLAKANSLCHPELTKGLGLDSSCGQNDKGSKVRFFASDVSHDALKLARKNAKSNGLNELIEFKEGDLFVPWQGQKFDIIVANLPYIPHEDMATLAFDLVHYEPRLALEGGVKGMDIYERFLPELPLYLKEEATAFLEIGYNQGPLITKIVQKVMPKARVEVLGDYANIDRIVVIKT